MFKQITKEFYDEITNCRDFKQYMKDNEEKFITITLPEYLELLLGSRNCTKKEIVKSAGIEKSYLYQIFNGRRKPSRDKLLRISLALRLSLEDTQKLLLIAEKPILYPTKKRDAALMCLINTKHSLHETQIYLHDMGFEILE
jgi:transcriptional regulator with XRE-family HTH domain